MNRRLSSFNRHHLMGTTSLSSVVTALEARYIFDAAAAASGAEIAADLAAQDVAEKQAFRVLESQGEASVSEQVERLAVATMAEDEASGKTVVFVDAYLGTDELATLKAGLVTGAELHLIDAKSDALAQMATVLQGYHDVGSVHILSHGMAGELHLGEGVVDFSALTELQKAALVSMNAKLGAEADLLIYGCDFGAGEIGRAAVATLASLTGADIAASSDATGATGLGADWDLEVTQGFIETSLAFDATAQDDFAIVLDSVTYARRVPEPNDFTSHDNYFINANVQTNNGYSNVESPGLFVDPHSEQGGTAFQSGDYGLVDSSQEGVLLDYTLKQKAWFGKSEIVPRVTFESHADNLVVAFYLNGDEVYRAPAGSDEKDFSARPILADQVRLIVESGAASHRQFNYVKLTAAAYVDDTTILNNGDKSKTVVVSFGSAPSVAPTSASFDTTNFDISDFTYASNGASGGQVTFTMTAKDKIDVDTVNIRYKAPGSAGFSDFAAQAYEIDTIAPATPTTALADTGASNTDRITNDETVAVGNLESGATWQYSTDGGTKWNPGTGTSFTLADGTYVAGDIRVRQTDQAGNVSAVGQNATQVEVDTSAPSAPTLAITDTGTVGDGITGDGTVTVSDIDSGNTWEYSADGGNSWIPGVGNNFILATGTYTANGIQVRQRDTAGNVSVVAQYGSALTVEAGGPLPTPALTITDTGVSNADGVTNDRTVTVHAIATGMTWEYSTDGGTKWNPGTGTSFTLVPGTYAANAIRVQQKDTAGNTSAAGQYATQVVVDTSRPMTPSVTIRDTGTSTSDGLTGDGTVTVGDLEGGTTTWEYSTDGGSTWNDGGTGTSFTLADGTYVVGDIQVRQTDAAGNTSDAGQHGSSLTVETSTPTTPTLTIRDTGASDKDGLTTDGTVTVGDLKKDATWEYSTDGGAKWKKGIGTSTSFTLADGTYAVGKIRVRQTSAAGNTSAAGQYGSELTVDTTAPTTPTVTIRDTGTSTSDGLTGDGTVTVGDLEGGASWEYSTDGGTKWSPGKDTSFTLADGTYTVGKIRVRQTDAAGNVSVVAQHGSELTVDTSTPTTPTLTIRDTGTSTSDGLTSDAKVTVGDLEKDATWEYSTDGGTKWKKGIGTSTSFTLADGTYAVGKIRVRQTSVAGNTSAAGQHGSELTVDTTAPTTPTVTITDTGTSASDGITSDGTVTVGDLESGASWEYSTDGGTKWSPGKDTSFTLADGTYTVGKIRVRQTDAAGNVSVVGQHGSALTVDTTPLTGTPTLAITDTGADTSDGITNDGTVTVSGLSTGGGVTWERSVDGGKNWNPGTGTTFNLTAGTYAANSIQVRETDVAGNVSAVGKNAAEVVVDFSRPTTPTVTIRDTGADTSDGLTSDGTVTVGLLEDGASWEYSTEVNAEGERIWKKGTGTSFTLADGTYAVGNIQVRQTDKAGNISVAGQHGSALTVDTSKPTTPTLAITDTGASDTDGITNNGTVTVGFLEGGTTIWERSVDGGKTWKEGTGNSFTLAEGSYKAGDIRVRQRDATGNISAVGQNAAEVVVDFSTPTTPTVSITDTGISTSDGFTSDAKVTVGALDDGASWEYSMDGGTKWNPGKGTSFTLADGTYAVGKIQVRQTDQAGNISTVGQHGSALTVDTSKPTIPTLAITDTGASDTDGITNNGTVTVGVLEGGTTIWEYSVDGGTKWNPGIGANFTLAEGSYKAGDIRVRQRDAAGNVSAVGQNAAEVVVDFSTPTTPTISIRDTGTSASDGLTSDAKVTVGALEDGVSWEYSMDGGTKWNSGTGTSFTLADGTYAVGDIRVRQRDAAGNISAAGQHGSALTVDTSKPTTPTLALATDTGASDTDGITNNGTVTVGVLEGGTTIWEYSVDGGTKWNSGTGANFTLADGTYAAGDIRVRQRDAAGNVSAMGQNAAEVVVDRSTPTTPTLSITDTGASDTDGITNNRTVTVGNLEKGASWEYSVDGGTKWNSGTGASFTLAEGSYKAGDIRVRQRDAAGNISAAGQHGVALIVDRTAPTGTPTLSIADTGVSDQDGITQDNVVTVGGLEGGTITWEYSVDGGTKWNSGTGASFTLRDGIYPVGTLQVRQRDAAGNVGATARNDLALIIDATAPSMPKMSIAGTGDASSIRSDDGVVRLRDLEPGAFWEYKTEKGDWQLGTGNSFTLAPGNYAVGDIQVRQRDAAGNISAAGQYGVAVFVPAEVASSRHSFDDSIGSVDQQPVIGSLPEPLGTEGVKDFVSETVDDLERITRDAGESKSISDADKTISIVAAKKAESDGLTKPSNKDNSPMTIEQNGEPGIDRNKNEVLERLLKRLLDEGTELSEAEQQLLEHALDEAPALDSFTNQLDALGIQHGNLYGSLLAAVSQEDLG